MENGYAKSLARPGGNLTGVAAAAFMAVERASRNHFGQVEHVAQFPGVEQFGVKNLAAVVQLDVFVTLLQVTHLLNRALHAFLGAEDADIVEHDFLHFHTDVEGIFLAIPVAQRVKLLARKRRRVGG